MILQPKRWESADDPKYDPIRHKPWFRRLLKRKKVLHNMKGCYLQYLDIGPDNKDHLSQQELCDLWNVSPREFRDYVSFHDPACVWRISLVSQSILDNAYLLYCDMNAEKPIQKFIEVVAPHYGIKGRPVCELWETCHNFYPTKYLK